MTKETMIIFVYDTECLRDETDDPVKAVLYFHPSWVSDTQKVALCGQLMGSAYFLNECFFKPRIIALQNGKFVFKEFGRFLLAVGTDRNISDNLLQHRANLLSSLVKLYHRDLQLIYDQFPMESQYKNLSDKLYHIFETYLPILQYNGSVFQNVPRLHVPKTASNIFLEAIQTLQCCQQTNGILGGAILYHNKVVASQLNNNITKQILLTDPLHLKLTGEQIISTDFHIPNGVIMLVIYIESLQYQKLKADAQRAQNLQTTQLGNIPFPFQYNKRKLIRDKSLIFTHIPEESAIRLCTSEEEVESRPTQTSLGPLAKLRPTHLPLRSKNLINRDFPESGIASINFDESDSYPEFIGRTSVVSTPMAENKVLAVGNIMSICANPEENNKSISTNTLQQINHRNSMRRDFERFFQNFIVNPETNLDRRNSLSDIQDSLKKFSKKMSLKQFSQTFKIDVNRNSGSNTEPSPDFIENHNYGGNSDNSDDNLLKSKTITDPTYPVFNSNGQPISRSLFQEFLEKYYKLWGEDVSDNHQDAEIAQLIAEFKEFDNELIKLDESLRKPLKNDLKMSALPDGNLNLNETLTCASLLSKVKSPTDKKSLSLPLKSISITTPSIDRNTCTSKRKYVGGVPLTPLMAKLSVLAGNENESARDGALGNNIEIQTPLNTTKSMGRRSSLKCVDDAVDALACIDSTEKHSSKHEKVELYICGQQNMTLLLIMEKGSSQQSAIVQKMFDICVARFPHMETYLNKSLNFNVESERRDGSYSFMSIDSKWDALERVGPWSLGEINTLEAMHHDMQEMKELTDLILRSNECVFYGHKSGKTEIFYKEPAREIVGLPPPSDTMGNIAMRAKLRLEREHSYVLF